VVEVRLKVCDDPQWIASVVELIEASQKGNANQAALAVARKMVAYLLAVDRGGRNFVPAEESSRTAA